MDQLSEVFSALEPNEKALFLARVVHMATIAARKAYAPDVNNPERSYENPDGAMLRDANNFVHRVTGYTMCVLNRTEMKDQDASVMAMIVEYFGTQRLEGYLAQWLRQHSN